MPFATAQQHSRNIQTLSFILSSHLNSKTAINAYDKVRELIGDDENIKLMEVVVIGDETKKGIAKQWQHKEYKSYMLITCKWNVNGTPRMF